MKDDNRDVRESIGLIFAGIYSLAGRYKADPAKIAAHEAAIVAAILEAKRKRCLRPVKG